MRCSDYSAIADSAKEECPYRALRTVDELHKRLVKNIRRTAKAARIAVTHLPDRAAVSRSHFWDVMGLKKSPTLKWLKKVAEALEVDASELLAREAGHKRP